MPSLRSAVSQPTLIVSDLNGVAGGGAGRGRTSRAVRPWGRTAFVVELERDPVLRRLGRRCGVAVAAVGLPGLQRELELAAVLTTGRDRARVAARFALGDPLEPRREFDVRAAAAAVAAAAAIAAAAAARRRRAARGGAGAARTHAELAQR